MCDLFGTLACTIQLFFLVIESMLPNETGSFFYKVACHGQKCWVLMVWVFFPRGIDIKGAMNLLSVEMQMLK